MLQKLLLLASSTRTNGGLNQVVSFFQVRASGTDVSNAIDITNVLMSFAILVVSVLGFVGLAIWVTRIGIDILLIVLRGTSAADKLSKLGTSKNLEAYQNVGSYIKSNVMEIIAVVILISLMVTSWLWRIFAIALSGVGSILNFLLGLDIDGMLSAQDVNAWKENIKTKTPAMIKNEYDEATTTAQGLLDELYSLADVDNNNPQKQDVIRRYAVALIKADHIGNAKNGINSSRLTTSLNLQEDYFNRHKHHSVCNTTVMGAPPATNTIRIWGGESVKIDCAKIN